MGNEQITILLIEDNLSEADNIKEMLSKAQQPEFSVQHVRNLAEGLNLLQRRNFDCVLVDLGLPDSQGLETALAVRKLTKRIPIVVLTVLDDEYTAIKSLQMDIQDYLLKCELNGRLLKRSIRYAIQRKRDTETLRISEERFRASFRDNPSMIVTLDAGLKMLSVNPICASVLGYLVEELEGRSFLEIFHEDDRTTVAKQLRMCLQTPRQVYSWQSRKIKKDRCLLWVEETAQAVYDLNGDLNVLLVCQDITERRRLEDDLKKTSMLNKLILASAGEGIVGLDLEGNQTFVNAAAAAMLGYEVHELVGKQSHSTWHYDLPDGSPYSVERCPIYAAYKVGEVHSGEETFLMKDGTAFPVQYTSRPFYIDEKIAGAVLTFFDITERKRAEEALVRAKEEWERTFDSVPELIAILDKQCRIVRMNRAMAERLGRKPGECAGLFCHNVVHGTGLPPGFCPHAKTMKDGRKHEAEVRDVHLGGDFLVSTTPLLGPDGKMIGTVHMARDITERKMAEDEIKRLNADLKARAVELEDANRELETFNYTVAHDLRQPLNVVSSYCQVIKEQCGDKLDEQCRHYLQEIYEGAMRMNRLIEALLRFSRLAHSEIKPDKIDLSALAHEAVTMLKLTEPKRQVDFRSAGGITANADAALLRVVLDNLIGNAWKYTGKREKAVIEFGAMELEGAPAYFVRDNGTGFDAASSDKLFVPFQRLPGTEECRGFGIGLATVERIIRRHGGRIWAEGEQGKGAIFYFTLQSGDSESSNKPRRGDPEIT